ncbi:IS110 family transposase [Spirosoma terrae]|uniref:IS110 family transposase n=1 Tax=Spirosoma terrae TaxID=1968276 RepID=A0A6L9L0N0_9BACT|nr:IS110 family transposase [Spirosoma terrae]NDU94065.1 IS110 family transposase [Spirosoma terrae]
MITNYIGIDIAAYSFVSAQAKLTTGYRLQTWAYKTPAQISQFVASLQPQTDHCVLEATGKYHLRLVNALIQAGIRVSVVNPLSVKRFGQMLTSITKTDARDAVLLARYGQQQQPPAYQLPSEQHQQLSQQRMVLNQLEQQMQALRNQQHALNLEPNPDSFSQQMLTDQLDHLADGIARLKERMSQLVGEQHPQNHRLLSSIPGFGSVTIGAFLEVLSGFADWQQVDSRKAFVKYIGLAPTIHESGSSVRKASHINQSGVPWLRQKLWLPVCTVAIRLKGDSVFKELYTRLRQGGKSFKAAIIAVMHKLVRVALAVLRSGKEFDALLNLPPKENLALAL